MFQQERDYKKEGTGDKVRASQTNCQPATESGTQPAEEMALGLPDVMAIGSDSDVFTISLQPEQEAIIGTEGVINCSVIDGPYCPDTNYVVLCSRPTENDTDTHKTLSINTTSCTLEDTSILSPSLIDCGRSRYNNNVEWEDVVMTDEVETSFATSSSCFDTVQHVASSEEASKLDSVRKVKDTACEFEFEETLHESQNNIRVGDQGDDIVMTVIVQDAEVNVGTANEAKITCAACDGDGPGAIDPNNKDENVNKNVIAVILDENEGAEENIVVNAFEPNNEEDDSHGNVETANRDAEVNITEREDDLDVEDDEVDNGNKRRPKTIIRKPDEWKRYVKKAKVMAGLAHETSSGNVSAAKRIKQGCGDKCKYKCMASINADRRKQMFNDYYGLDHNRKRDFIAKSITEVRPKYSYKKEDSRRSVNFGYYFQTPDGQKTRVCKVFFCDTLDISSTTLTTIRNKMRDTGIVEEDKRGKHKKHIKLEEVVRQGVIDHINSFSRIESHYCRSQTQREFIDGGLSISQMYVLYTEYCKEKQLPVAKKSMYSFIFNTEFNIGFFRPKKDQCPVCVTFKNLSEAEKEIQGDKYSSHLKEKELSRTEKLKDVEESRSSETTIVACFDLQAVIQLPCGEISTFFYKRKLNCFNFTIYNITSKKGHCFVWHEGSGGRGANEIATNVFEFLKTCEGKNVIFYSDNCSSQNKNKFLLSMYLYAIQHLNIPSITHKFLIVGHTQNEGDAMHSCIETAKRQALKSGPIYVPSQFLTVVQLAKRNGIPYAVRELDTSEIIDWKSVASQTGNNFQTNTERKKVMWNNIKVFQVKKEHQDSIFYKNSYQDVDMKEIKVRQPQRGRRSMLVLTPAYSEPTKMSQLKKKDLLDLCKSNLIPKPYHDFFQNLRSSSDSQQEDSGESGDE